MTQQQLLKAKIPCLETGITLKKTICGICDPQQCGLKLSIKDGRIIKAEGNEDHPGSGGNLCGKGAATRQYVYSEKRLKTPLKRVGERGEGKFIPITWDEALDTVAWELNRVKREYGPESVMFTSGYSKYYRPWLSRLCLLFGSPNYITETGACFEAMHMAKCLVAGCMDGPDMGRTDCLLVWSSNPFYTGVINAKGLQANLDRGMKMIVVDPRITPTTQRAAVHLRPRPGTDGAVALGMANTILMEGLEDRGFISQYTKGFEEYRTYAAQFTPDRVEELTGVPAAELRAAALLYAQSKSAAIMASASPVVHHTNGVQNYRAIFSLAALTGNYGKPGGQAVPPGIKSRMREFSYPVAWSDLPQRVGVDQYPIWGAVCDDDATGMGIPRQIRTGKPYPLKAMFGVGFNHRMYPDPAAFAQAMKELDFIALVDLFDTETLKYADIVLPTCSSVERSELRFYGNGTFIVTEPAIEPLYDSKSDVDIMCLLSSRLGIDDPLMNHGLDTCLDYILEPTGLTARALRAYPDTFRATPEMMAGKPLDYFKKEGFPTPSGKFEFASSVLERFSDHPGHDPLPLYHPPGREPRVGDEFDLVLNTGSRQPMLVHTRMYHVGWSQTVFPMRAACDMNPADAKKRGIVQGDEVVLSTPEGSLTVMANLTEAALPGVVHIFHGNAKADVNTLFPMEYVDPISGYPGYKSAVCKVEKAPARGGQGV